MYLRRILTTLLSAFIFLMEAVGSPVRNTDAVYTQPDGTSFSVTVTGDEWIKIRKTKDGCAIVRDDQGWWCYGIYNGEGILECTGYHVGNAPASVIEASRDIPYHLLAERSMEIRAAGQESALRALETIRQQAVLTRSSEETIQKRGIALLVEFSDIKFTFKKEHFHNLLNQKDYNGTGSAKDYYESQFGENWEFNFDVSDIITLSWPSEHYGKNGADGTDIRPWDMVTEACKAADGNIDFAQYDQDGDGIVDNVYVFYAGLSESEHSSQPDLIWPHQYYIYSGEKINLFCDGKRIDRYACSAEITGDRSFTGIGTFCHEFGHTLGLVDMYDTDSDKDGGWAAALWKHTSLMDGGNYNNNSATPPNLNCIDRELLGLSSPIIIEEGQTYTMEPIHKSGTYYKLESGIEDEYYLLECRYDEGWDEFIGGKGMLVYHIDKKATEIIGTTPYSKWQANTVNAEHAHQCADLIEADGRTDLITSHNDFNQSLKGIFFPQDNATAIVPGGNPGLTYWYGDYHDISITAIKTDGVNITFSASKTASLSEVPEVTDVSFTTFPDAAIITFSKHDLQMEGTASVEWKKSGSSDAYTTVVPMEFEDGKYACKIEGLESGNVTYETRIRFEREDNIGEAYRLSFMTKRKPAITWPYIYMNSSKIKQGDSIPLHVANTDSPVSWEFDGKEIEMEKGFYFCPAYDGTLQAVVTHKDGSKDIIIKEIELTE